MEKLVKEGNIDCHFSRCGHLEAAFKPAHYDGLKHEQEFLNNHLNHATQSLGPKNMQGELGSDFYHGGLVDPMSAGVHPANYIAALIRMTDAAGARISDGFSPSLSIGLLMYRNIDWKVPYIL